MLCVSQSLEEDCVIFGNIITRIKIVGGDSVGVVTALYVRNISNFHVYELIA